MYISNKHLVAHPLPVQSTRSILHTNLAHDRVRPVLLVQKYRIGIEFVVDRAVHYYLFDVVEVMQYHLREERITGGISLKLRGVDVVELVVLLHPQEQRGTDGVV